MRGKALYALYVCLNLLKNHPNGCRRYLYNRQVSVQFHRGFWDGEDKVPAGYGRSGRHSNKYRPMSGIAGKRLDDKFALFHILADTPAT